ncbi:flagellar hook-basal body complex protein FliE [Polymorphobacter multimanifer]|uniref:Flagellar hook-basal body complex protein FliE n=1 Tax=Polymorphobacter multimanifer TaxID=1070431 RepID=A0A841L203_9SPHN|nr:flagellar hook-basal body complex protein FliE [Polymorphobacter multimanifer]MBB6226346.1 flagellar hook-basal body complex protein FliE [Polymorphobacter multimanifer]GGI89404.1 flagellar hook-basal body complex protein FliE [Polymorphobacter multimanifer]
MLPPVDASSVMALRARILAQSEQLGALSRTADAPKPAVPFESAMSDALKAVSQVQDDAGARSAAFERGETQDLAAVMIARQKASLAFEATLQARNRLLGAYKDVMSMPL